MAYDIKKYIRYITMASPRKCPLKQNKPNNNMKQLVIDETKARALYPNADAVMKQSLEDTFGKDFFKQNVMQRIGSNIHNAYAELGKRREEEIPFACPKNKFQESLNATCDAWILTEALNEGWVPDFGNGSEYKYFMWFSHKSGVGLSFDAYVGWSSVTVVGPRFAFRTRELLEFAKDNFETNVYSKVMNM